MGDVNRRDVLKTLAAVPAFSTAAAVPAAPASANPKARMSVRMACTSQRNPGGLADAAHSLCRHIERLSGSTFEFQLIEGCRAPFAMLEAGEADAVFGYEGDKAALHPAFGYFAGLPGEFSLPVQFIEGWLSSQPCTELWSRLSAEFGIKTLYTGHTNSRSTLWSTAPLEQLHNIAEMSFNCSGLAADVIKGIGGRHALRQVPDDTSHADAVLCRHAADALAGGLAKTRPFVARTTLGGQASALSLTFARAAWDRMASSDRAMLCLIIDQLRASGVAQHRTVFATAEEPILRALAEARQTEEYELPGEIRSAMDRVAAAVIADTATFDSHSRAINAAYFNHLSQFGHRFSQVGV